MFAERSRASESLRPELNKCYLRRTAYFEDRYCKIYKLESICFSLVLLHNYKYKPLPPFPVLPMLLLATNYMAHCWFKISIDGLKAALMTKLDAGRSVAFLTLKTFETCLFRTHICLSRCQRWLIQRFYTVYETVGVVRGASNKCVEGGRTGVSRHCKLKVQFTNSGVQNASVNRSS